MVHIETKSCTINEIINICSKIELFIFKIRNIFDTYIMKQTITLTESQLRQIINESINEALEDEGLGQQIWQGMKSAVGMGDMGKKNYQNRVIRSKGSDLNFKNRYNAFKTNFSSQREIDKANDVVNYLKNLIDKGYCNWQSTLGEVWGKMNQIKAQATRRGSRAQNDIYK